MVLSEKLIKETEALPQLKFPSLTTKTPLFKEFGNVGVDLSVASLIGFLLQENAKISAEIKRRPLTKSKRYV